MPGTLQDKIALVTGAGSGIGRATSLVMAREGARVVVSDINAEGAESTLSAIKDLGGQGTFIHADVSKAEDVQALVAVWWRPTAGWTAPTTTPGSKASWRAGFTNTRKTSGTG